MKDYAIEKFFPIHGRTFEEQRMRVHQQWWAWKRLHRELGQPEEEDGQPFPVLTDVDQENSTTGNFLTPAIHEIAMNTPRLPSDKHFNHLLSSLPMAVNLFGVLIDPADKLKSGTPLDGFFPKTLQTPYAPSAGASELVSVLVGHAVEVLRVDFEIPGRLGIGRRHPLGDGTSADVLVEYRDDSGTGLIVIETKLTEALSNGGDLMNSNRKYLTFYNAPSSPFSQPLSAPLKQSLEDEKLVQWTRNQLLAFALQQEGGHRYHKYWTVFPKSHVAASNACEKYCRYLKNPQATFAGLTLESILERWDPMLKTPMQRDWRDCFRQRYLDLSGSDDLWQELTKRWSVERATYRLRRDRARQLRDDARAHSPLDMTEPPR